MMQKAKGNSSSKLEFSTSHKSISVSKTFKTDLYTLEEAQTQAQILTRELWNKLVRDKQKGRLVSLVLRDTTFHNQMRSKTLNAMTDNYATIWEVVSELLLEHFEPVGYRHIGVSIGSLKRADQIIEQPTIFEEPVNTTQDIVASLNRSLDSKVFMTAGDLLKKKEKEGKNEHGQ